MVKRDMQLNLFEDNRTGILLSLADELIRAKKFDEALSIHEELMLERPDDKGVSALHGLVSRWRELVADIEDDPAYLNTLWLQREELTHPPLRKTVLEILLDGINALPQPECIHIESSFHQGVILTELGLHAEAAASFRSALAAGILPAGRFHVWCGNALTRLQQEAEALRHYRNAFRDDPYSVDINSINNSLIHRLHISLAFEDEDIDEQDEIAWLPVWGWLCDVFPLPMDTVTSELNSEFFAEQFDSNVIPVPRLWFDMLLYAEFLRSTSRENSELTAVRRLMKKLSLFMFEQYLEKIRGGFRPL